MLALTTALAVALSLGAGDDSARRPAPAQAGGAQRATLTNSQRARLGLLPRKAPKKVSAAKQRGRRIINTVSHSPTFLPEPIPLAGAPGEYAEVEAVADAPGVAAAPGEVQDLRFAASSVVTDVTIVLRYGP